MLPIPMILTCPSCGVRHIDEGEFATKPHHTHACQGCGMVWRPALVDTVGVQFLPGYKNDQDNPLDDVPNATVADVDSDEGIDDEDVFFLIKDIDRSTSKEDVKSAILFIQDYFPPTSKVQKIAKRMQSSLALEGHEGWHHDPLVKHFRLHRIESLDAYLKSLDRSDA